MSNEECGMGNVGAESIGQSALRRIFRRRVAGAGCGSFDCGFWISDFGLEKDGMRIAGCGSLDFGFGISDFGFIKAFFSALYNGMKNGGSKVEGIRIERSGSGQD